MKKSVLILFRDQGPVYRRNLRAFAKAARNCGYEITVIAPAQTSFVEGEVDRVFFCEQYELVAELRQLVRAVCDKHAIARIFASHEKDVLTAAFCRRDNRIQGLLPENALLFRDKNAMSKRARELNVPVPEDCLPHTIGVLEEFVARVGYPIVLKPYDGMACLGTLKVSTPQQLAAAWARVSDDRHNYRAENFIKGKQFHVDCLIQNDEIVFELLSEYAHPLLDNFREQGVGSVTWPPSQHSAAHKRILDLNKQVLQGFGLYTGVAHTEFFVTDEGEVYFGESGARMGGAHVVPMIQAAYGIELAAEWMKVDLDSTYRPQVQLSRNAGALFLPVRARGRIVSIGSANELREVESVLDAEVWSSVGDELGDPTMCCDTLGYVVCAGTSVADVRTRMDRIREGFSVDTVLLPET